MELVGDVAHVDSRFGLFHDGVSVEARYLHGFAPNVPKVEIILHAHDGTPS
jgi:hypothetical protein